MRLRHAPGSPLLPLETGGAVLPRRRRRCRRTALGRCRAALGSPAPPDLPNLQAAARVPGVRRSAPPLMWRPCFCWCALLVHNRLGAGDAPLLKFVPAAKKAAGAAEQFAEGIETIARSSVVVANAMSRPWYERFTPFRRCAVPRVGQLGAGTHRVALAARTGIALAARGWRGPSCLATLPPHSLLCCRAAVGLPAAPLMHLPILQPAGVVRGVQRGQRPLRWHGCSPFLWVRPCTAIWGGRVLASQGCAPAVCRQAGPFLPCHRHCRRTAVQSAHRRPPEMPAQPAASNCAGPSVADIAPGGFCGGGPACGGRHDQLLCLVPVIPSTLILMNCHSLYQIPIRPLLTPHPCVFLSPSDTAYSSYVARCTAPFPCIPPVQQAHKLRRAWEYMFIGAADADGLLALLLLRGALHQLTAMLGAVGSGGGGGSRWRAHPAKSSSVAAPCAAMPLKPETWPAVALLICWPAGASKARNACRGAHAGPQVAMPSSAAHQPPPTTSRFMPPAAVPT